MKNFLRIILLATLVLMASHVANIVPNGKAGEGESFSKKFSKKSSSTDSRHFTAQVFKSKSSVK